jgi:hypothetical protein
MLMVFFRKRAVNMSGSCSWENVDIEETIWEENEIFVDDALSELCEYIILVVRHH